MVSWLLAVSVLIEWLRPSIEVSMRLFCCERFCANCGSLVARPEVTVLLLTLVLLIVPPTCTVCAAPLRLRPLLTLPPTTAPEPLLRFLCPPLTSPTTVRPGVPVEDAGRAVI